MRNVKINKLFEKAIRKFYKETSELDFLPLNRYNRSFFPTIGQYDWFSGQLLYCLIRYKKPQQIIEVSTSSGYSTLFSALALKKNGTGKIHTFDTDRKALTAAQKNFKQFKVEKFIKIYVGNAKINIRRIKDLRNTDIAFLDSLHTEEFARWFIENIVLKIKTNALFHMHDIMPEDARVRLYGGPPWGITSLFTYRKIVWDLYNRLKGNKFSINKIDLKFILPDKKYPLTTFNGNDTGEALFGIELTKLMNSSDYIFCHNIVDKYAKLLSSHKYDNTAIGKEDASGKSFEWNGSLWSYTGALSKAFKQLTGKE